MASLASYLKNNETGEVVPISILNKKRLAKGERFLQALGGAAMMTPEGREFVERGYGAEFQGEGYDRDDAQFVLPAEYSEEIIRLFRVNQSLCQRSPMDEVLHELEQEPFCDCTILPPGTLVDVYTVHESTCRQAFADDGIGTSARAQAQDVPTKRMFFVHTLCVSGSVFEKLCASPYVQVLSKEELDTTQMGRTKGVAMDGTPLADNLCNWDPHFI